MAAALPFDLALPLDLSSPVFNSNKFEVYAWLLEHEPVCEVSYNVLKLKMVCRYADCEQVLRGSSFRRQRDQGSAWWGRLVPRSWRMLFDTMLNKDNPDHKRLRGFISRAFTPRAVERVEPWTRSLTQTLMDRMEAKAKAREPVDIVEDFALPLPARVIGQLLGIEDEDTEAFVGLVAALTDSSRGIRAVRGLVWDLPRIVRFVERVIARKRAAPGDDLLSTLVQLEDEGGRLSTEELASMVLVLIIGGYETTAHLIGSGMVALLDDPSERAALRSDPTRIPAAIEEMLRLFSPAQTSDRVHAIEDVELSGVHLPKGTTMIACVGAANRDPRVFERPDAFDASRPPHRHLSFGKGPHFCVGAALARLEGRIALTGLLERFTEMRLAVPVEQLEFASVPTMHSYRAVPVVLR